MEGAPGATTQKEKKGKRRDETSAERAARKERKREKKARKEEKRKKKEGGGGGVEWGKYGVISESDIFEKEAEFRLWLVEERFINPETLPKSKEKELFRTFVEDYNTATLPHSKYYSLASHSAQLSALRMGESLVSTSETYDARADEEALRKSFRRERKEEDSFRSREELEQLRRIERERVERAKMERLGMEVKASMGVRYDTEYE
ncbi:hypothetical protein BT69DRAFT_1307431 [Atractiella rhizophila]|nr:hypothetical protein BT69DRAFT_1307431 [Atractiella rhizophila]